MAKLSFRYGAMNSGKSTLLMQAAYNYEERGMRVIVVKSAIDTKGDDQIVSRIGLSRKVDVLLQANDSAYDQIVPYLRKNISCIFVDEAQFLMPNQVDDFFIIAKLLDTPVLCYGLRSDFKTNAFPGSLRLMEIADDLEELVTICRCGQKARFNGRKVNGHFVSEGAQVAIDEQEAVTYESLCGACYLDKVKNINIEEIKTLVKKIK